jgi:hypothetical protein
MAGGKEATGGQYFGWRKEEKNTKLENEGEGTSMKAIPSPQEALTRRQ